MEDIVRQVQRARRRLNWEQFLRVAPWTLFTALIVALIALAVPKIWVVAAVESDEGWNRWMLGWLGGSFVVGLAAAAIWTWIKRHETFSAAVELDRRFGLKERVASSLALSAEERETEIGRALLDDAAKRVSTLEVGDRFQVRLGWQAALPVLPLVAGLLLALVANATAPPSKSLASDDQAKKASDQVKKSTDELKKKLEEERKKAEEAGLEEVDDLFKKLQEGLDKLQTKEKLDRKEAMVKLNDLSQDLAKKRDELANVDQMRKQLDQLKNFQPGPGDKFGKALKDGNLKKAAEEVKKLQEKLDKGEMSNEQKEQLQKQLEEMQQKLEQMAQNHEAAKQELQQQIKQKQDAGDQAGAAKLQQKLDQMTQMDKQMDKMQQMAKKLGEAAQAMKEGQQSQANQKLSELSDDLSEMQQQLDQLETVDEMMKEIADAKSAMNCKKCNGEGCSECDGEGDGEGKPGNGKGKGKGKGNQPGRGLGEGQGVGDRPEERTDTGFFDSRVRAKPKAGEAVRTGYADGANLPGRSFDAVKQEIVESLQTDPDPLTDQRLNRSQREQARQFFENSGAGAKQK